MALWLCIHRSGIHKYHVHCLVSNMHNIIRRHLPLITSQIEFSLCPWPELPAITPRKCFLDDSIHSPDDVGNNNMDRKAFTSEKASDKASTSDSSSNSGSDEGFGPGPSLIPKPPGEAGRPQSGGFNLEVSLGWPKPTFQKILVSPVARLDTNWLTPMQRYTHLQASCELDTTKSYSSQGKGKVEKVCIAVSFLFPLSFSNYLSMQVALHYPLVSKYCDLWPVRCILKLHLKSTSEIARRAKTRVTTKKIKKVWPSYATIEIYSISMQAVWEVSIESEEE